MAAAQQISRLIRKAIDASTFCSAVDADLASGLATDQLEGGRASEIKVILVGMI